MILCWSAKGGSGTTVVACALALAQPEATLVDLAGDAATALGLAEPNSPGISEWMASPNADSPAMHRLCVPVHDGLQLLPLGNGPLPDDQWDRLAKGLESFPHTIVDAGAGVPHEALRSIATHSLLVTRPCYLALRRALAMSVRPTGVVLISEAGRALTARDIEHAIGVPVVAEIPVDPAIARAVDAGLLASRVPRTLQIPLRRVA